MTKNNADSDGSRTDELAEQSYPELMNVARSARENHDADISTDGPTKPELIEWMADEDVHLDGETWMVGDEEVERLESNPSPDRDGSSEPQPEVVLYAQTRAGATEDRLDELEEVLGEVGYELRQNDSEDSMSIIIPVEDADSGIDSEEVTRDEVYEMAQDLDIDGRSDMSKAELISAVEANR